MIRKIIEINEDKCDGCGDCVTACPYGMIEQDDQGLAYKCDYCDGDPACVKECYPEAIVYRAENKALRKLRHPSRSRKLKAFLEGSRV